MIKNALLLVNNFNNGANIINIIKCMYIYPTFLPCSSYNLFPSEKRFIFKDLNL